MLKDFPRQIMTYIRSHYLDIYKLSLWYLELGLVANTKQLNIAGLTEQ